MALVDFGKLMQAQSFGGVQPMQSPIGQPSVTTPSADPTAARNQKLAVMLYALGGALKGQDPLQQGLGLQQAIQQRQKQKQETELENQLQESLNRGDTDTALSLAARLGKTSVVQYLQGERRRTEPQLLGDGKYTVSFDESGKPKIDINQEIIDAELELAKKEKEIARIGKTLPATLIKSEDEDFTALSNLGGVETDIDFFIDAVREGNLEVGYGEDIQAAFGNLGIMRQYMDAESKEKLANYNAFERWKQTYVNESLRLNKGPQTEGDAQRAMKELEAAKTPGDVLRVLQDLKKTNAREVKFRKEQINRRRSTADVEPYDFSNLSWKIIE